MAVVTDSNIVTRAEQIKNETNTGANTATRVGSWMRDSWDTMIDKLGSVVSASSFAIAITDIVNQLNAKANTTYVDSQNTAQDNTIATKANTTYVDAQDANERAYADATFIPFGQKGSANGVPFLDSNGKVPESQLPSFDLQKVTDSGNQTTNEIIVGNPTGFNVIIYPYNVTVDNNNTNINNRNVASFLDAGITFRKALSSVNIRLGQYNNQIILLPNTSGTLALQTELTTLQTQIDNINTLLQSNDVDLDNVQELVDAIKTVQTSLSTILVNDLTTGGTTKALTAEQGVVLKGLIDGKLGGTLSIQETIIDTDNIDNGFGTERNIKFGDFNTNQVYVSVYGGLFVNKDFYASIDVSGFTEASNNSKILIDIKGKSNLTQPKDFSFIEVHNEHCGLRLYTFSYHRNKGAEISIGGKNSGDPGVYIVESGGGSSSNITMNNGYVSISGNEIEFNGKWAFSGKIPSVTDTDWGNYSNAIPSKSNIDVNTVTVQQLANKLAKLEEELINKGILST